MPPPAVSNTAADQAASAVSIASKRIAAHVAKWASRGSQPISPKTASGASFSEQDAANRHYRLSTRRNRNRSDGPDFGDVGNIVAQQILNAMPQCRSRRRTARARALHVE